MRKLFLLLICVLLGAAAQAQTAAQLFAQAKTQTDPAKQVKLLNKVISKSARMTNAYHYRGDAYRKQGRFRQAVADYTKTIELAPKDPFRYYARALAYMDMGRYSSAEADLTKAVSLKPAYWNFYLSRAQSNLKQNKYDAAVRDFKKYLQHRKKTDSVSLDLAEAYFGAYKYAEAQKELQRLLARGSENPKIYLLLGRIKNNQGASDEAISFYSKAINREDDYALAYRYRAAAFKEIGDADAALEDYTRLLELQPDAISYNRRGLVYEDISRFKEAAADYSKAIELNPKWPIAYNNRGFAKMHLKDWKGAQEDLETAIRLDGSMPTPYINLAGVYWLNKKDKKNTYQNLEKAIKRNFKDFDSLYDEDQKGWMFKGINKTAEFRAIMYK